MAHTPKLIRHIRASGRGLPCLTDAIEPERMGAASIRVFLKVAKELSLSPKEQVSILHVSEATYQSWQRLALAEEPLVLDEGILVRISHLLGIYKELATIFKESHGEWLRRPNSNPLFGGKPALDLMLNDADGLTKVHEHLGPSFFGGWG